jgi:hypothetical protein
MKASPASVRLELVVAATGETLEVAEDRRILAKLGLRDKAVLNAKLSQVIGWRWGEDRRILAKLGLRDKAVQDVKLSQVIGWRWGEDRRVLAKLGLMDFPDFYTIKSSSVGDLVVKILTYYFNF